MSPLLMALLGVLLIPLFVGTWRVSLAGLALQGVIMGSLAFRMDPHPSVAGEWLTFVDLVVVRGVVVPMTLYATLLAQNAPARQDVIPPNLLSWTLALGAVLMAFNFAGTLAPEGGTQETLLAVAAAGVLLGFLVLATQSEPFGQMVGLLRIENGIALFGLGGAHHAEEHGLKVGEIAILLVSVALYRGYLKLLHEPRVEAEGAEREPTL